MRGSLARISYGHKMTDPALADMSELFNLD
jgi:hypothetical protein